MYNKTINLSTISIFYTISICGSGLLLLMVEKIIHIAIAKMINANIHTDIPTAVVNSTSFNISSCGIFDSMISPEVVIVNFPMILSHKPNI